MTTAHHRAAFDIDSTAADVLTGVDLHGRTAVVTGGYSGVGLATTRALAAAGADVVVPARRPEDARLALRDVEGVTVDELDLADLGSVARYAERHLATERPIDLLVNNAGIMACPETRVGPGWEAQLAVNHLGHFALTNLLWPALAAARARVVVLASGLSDATSMRWDDLHFTRGYDKWAAYTQSKHANLLFAARLDELGRASGVRAFSASPGYVLTPLQRHLPRTEMVAAGWIDETGEPLLPEFRAPEQGAATPVWAATTPELSAVGPAYCARCSVVKVFDGDDDRADAERLWRLSAALTGVDAFGG